MFRKVVYDNIVFSLQKFGGISNYWNEMALRLSNDSDFDAFFIERRNHNIYSALSKSGANRVIKESPELPIFLNRFMNPRLSLIDSKFVFHSSYNRYSLSKNARNITTIHDLNHFKYYRGARRYIHNFQKKYALDNSEAIIAISENTRRDLLNYFSSVSPDKVTVIYNGVSDEFEVINSDVYVYELNFDLINRPYILWVSGREAYKNFDFAVELIARLPEFKFYIVGGTLTHHEMIKLNRYIPGRWLLFTGITSKVLNELYNHAHALLYPSSSEGFGIPILEAMKAGCPFVALNSSSIPEVAGKAGVLMNELNIEEFSFAIENIDSSRINLVNLGLHQASKFSWDKCYMETKAIYKKLLMD